MTALLIALVGFLTISAATEAQSNEDVARCARETNADLQLSYCTRAIESGRLSALELPLAFYNRGTVYADRDDYEHAIWDFSRAIELKPNFMEALYNRGTAYEKKGEYDRAIQDLNRVIALNPKIAEAFHNRGIAQKNKGDYERARQDYDQAIRLSPNSATMIMSRGVLWFDQGQFDAAAVDFARASELKPPNEQLILLLYLVKVRAGRNGRQGLVEATSGMDLSAWPGPLFALYLEKITPQMVLQAAAADEPQERRNSLCLAHFYVGEYFLIHGSNRTEARPHLQSAADTCPYSFSERASAKAELARITSPH